MPPVVNPPLTWVMAVESKGDCLPGKSSILQSCGRSSVLHLESLKSRVSAPGTFPSVNFQSLSIKKVRLFPPNGSAVSD